MSAPHPAPRGAHGAERNAPAAAPGSGVRLIGDGSTAYTGKQPNVPKPERLDENAKPLPFDYDEELIF